MTTEKTTTQQANNEKARVWFSPEGKKLDDQSILSWLQTANSDKDNEYELIVGTDSHLHGREFRFVTVVCLYRKGKGGYYNYTTSYEPRSNYKGNQKARMFNEVSLSIDMSNWLLTTAEMIPTIHIDASPSDAGEFTSAFSDQLKGYALASGFDCELKPASFVANAIADKHTK